jgi:hypothetical protein
MYIVLKTKQLLPHFSHLKSVRGTPTTLRSPLRSLRFPSLRLRFPLRFSSPCLRLLKLRFLLHHSYRGILRGSFIITAAHSICFAPLSPLSLV